MLWVLILIWRKEQAPLHISTHLQQTSVCFLLETVLHSFNRFWYLCQQCCKHLNSSPSRCQTQSRRWCSELWGKLDHYPCHCSSTSSSTSPVRENANSSMKCLAATWVTQKGNRVHHVGKTFGVTFWFCSQSLNCQTELDLAANKPS